MEQRTNSEGTNEREAKAKLRDELQKIVSQKGGVKLAGRSSSNGEFGSRPPKSRIEV